MSAAVSPHIYLDVDDVLAETTRALAQLARARFDRRVEFDEMADFDLAVTLGFDPHEFDRFMQAAHEDAFLLEIAPMTGAVEIVSCWHRAGAEISVVTGRPPHSRDATERWLARERFPYHRLEHVDKYGRFDAADAPNKEDLADRGYAIVIEDSPEMAEFFAEASPAIVLLVDRPWNRASHSTHPRIRRVHDWSDIATACAGLHPVLGPWTS